MLSEHIEYLSDGRRLALYERAIRQVVRPGQRVADLGCGSGVLGLMCLQAGASHVLAIDETAILDIARESFARAGFAEACAYARANTLRTPVPDPVDVAICDHVGYLGFDYGIVPMLRDARRRYLKPTGSIIPATIRMSLAAVQSAACQKIVEQWNTPPVPAAYHWVRERMIHAKHAVKLSQDEIVTTAGVLGSLRLGEDYPDFLSWSVELEVTRAATVHGLAGWFDCELAEGLWMTNSPVSREAIGRPQVFLPIETPVEVRAGDRLTATLMTRIDENMLAWTVEFPASGQRFNHAAWQTIPSSLEALQRANPTRVPRLGPLGAARLLILNACAAGRSAQAIETAVIDAHPDLFPTKDEISKFVAQVLIRDAET